MTEEKKKYYCEKCNKTLGSEQFYTTNNLEKYPSGRLPICKKCLTMHVDNWNPDTYIWILQEADVPYVPEEWNKLMRTYAKDRSKVTGTTIVGRYLAKMRLNQWNKYKWADSKFLQELEANKREAVMKEQGYSAVEIAEAQEKAKTEIPEQVEVPDLAAAPQELSIPGPYEPFDEEPQEPDIDFDLTDEDKLYLRLKWGKHYRPEEWVRLEQMYNEMMESYDIQTAGHIDTLKLLCKTSLKANQLIDASDVEGYQKMSKVYDALMKSGKFSAAQNKAENGDAIDSIGEIVALCEKEGFIPRYYIDQPNDKVDQTILDMQRYTKTLINEETNLGSLIEDAIRNNQKEDEEDEKVDDTDTGLMDEDNVIEEIEEQLEDNDFADYSEFLDNEEATDADLLAFLGQEKER